MGRRAVERTGWRPGRRRAAAGERAAAAARGGRGRHARLGHLARRAIYYRASGAQSPAQGLLLGPQPHSKAASAARTIPAHLKSHRNRSVILPTALLPAAASQRGLAARVVWRRQAVPGRAAASWTPGSNRGGAQAARVALTEEVASTASGRGGGNQARGSRPRAPGSRPEAQQQGLVTPIRSLSRSILASGSCRLAPSMQIRGQ